MFIAFGHVGLLKLILAAVIILLGVWTIVGSSWLSRDRRGELVINFGPPIAGIVIILFGVVVLVI